MADLEFIAGLPFELGTYNFDLLWKCFNVGYAHLSFYSATSDSLPCEAKSIYDGQGDLYKVIFDGKINFPVLRSIADGGLFITYVCIERNNVVPLLSVAKTKILGKDSSLVCVYDRKKNMLKINSEQYEICADKMSLLREPSSHVINLLFRPTSGEGEVFCGYFHNSTGQLKELVLKYSLEGEKLVGNAVIPAGGYLLNTNLLLRLAYSRNTGSSLFIPSLKDDVSVGHHFFGFVRFVFKEFRK